MCRIPIIGIMLFLLCACSDSPDSNNEPEPKPIKYGSISNTCGPTDVPVVELILTDEKIECSVSPRDFANINTYLKVSNTQDISIGMMLEPEPRNYDSSDPVSAINCDAGFENCVPIGPLSVEFTGQGSDTLEGVYTIKNGSETSTGNFLIKQCYKERPLCG